MFANTGGLYFKSAGDSITYEFPHKIYGISGFQNRTPVMSSTDLGNNARSAKLIYKEYTINTGTGYANWKELTGSNLANETVSASAGFYMKVRLTARPGLKYTTQTVQFTGGESVNGQTSGATATLLDLEDEGTTGTLVFSNVTGTFTTGENIRVGTTVYVVGSGLS